MGRSQPNNLLPWTTISLSRAAGKEKAAFDNRNRAAARRHGGFVEVLDRQAGSVLAPRRRRRRGRRCPSPDPRSPAQPLSAVRALWPRFLHNLNPGNDRSSKGMRTLRPRRSRRISVQSQSPPAPKGWRRWLGKIGTACVALVGFVAASIAVVTTCWPRMVADAPGLFDDANAYSISFAVTNTGWIPLRDVRLSVGICSMKMDRSSFSVNLGPQYSEDKCGVPGFRIGDPWRWERQELVRDEKFTINLSDQLSTPSDKIESDDVLINRALSDAPEVVARSATVITMGANGEIRTLRQGTGQWTCTPGCAPTRLIGPRYAAKTGVGLSRWRLSQTTCATQYLVSERCPN
jgi:hypothetical protein